MLRFQHASLLTALALIPLLAMLFAALLLWRKKKITEMGSPEQVRAQLSGYIAGRDTLRFLLVSIALGAIILGCANLQKGGATETIERKGVDVMIALDLSKSMLAKDIQPDRLTRAKQFVERLTDKMSNDRVGLVVFAGKSYLQVPLTIDYSALKLILQTLSPDMIPTQGTVIGEAIRMCNQSFSSKERKFKSIILISDGEDHDETAIAAVNEAKEQGAIIHTIGIGSPQGAPLFDPATNGPKLDEQGNQVITKLNEQELKSIAAAGNGTYTLLGNTDVAAAKITEAIDDMEQRNLGSVVFANYDNYFQYFLFAGLFLIIAEWVLPKGSKRKPKGIAVKALMLLPIVFFTVSNVQAQSAKSLIAKGNRLYAEKKFSDAGKSYRAAMQKDTGLAATGAYNLGNSLYKQNKADEARKAFELASKKSSDKNAIAAANYNVGNTYMSEKKWQDAIDAYKAALRRNPQDADAKYNLSYAMKMLKKEGGGGKNKDQNKDQNKDDKKEEQKDKQDQKDQKDQQDQKDGNQDQKDQKPEDKKEGEGQQPQPSKLSEKQAEQILNALQQEEKKLQEKNKKRLGAPAKLEKDW